MRLSLSNAIEFVRARMDELSYSNDDMIVPADDDRNFDTTVEKLLPEAAEFVYRAAPARLLEPETEMEIPSVGYISDRVESTELLENGAIRLVIPLDSGYLRFVSFKSTDSDVYLTAPVAFDSPEARMQINPYTRGTYDRPVIVERKTPGRVEYTYYTVRDKDNVPGFTLYSIDKPSYADDNSIFCPDFLSPAVLNRVTGMVLEAYGSAQQAQAFYQKSATYFA